MTLFLTACLIISSCSTFSLFNTFAPLSKLYTVLLSFRTNFSKHHLPISPGICMKTPPKKPIPKNTTSKSVRTPSFKEAMKSAARPLLLPRKPTSSPSKSPPFVLCELTKLRPLLFLKNTQKFCFTKKKRLKTSCSRCFFLLG